MPNARQAMFDAEALTAWRKVLPGVPDDQVVLPRYYARNLGPFPAPPHHTDDPGTWEFLSDVTLYLFVAACDSTGDSHGGDKTLSARRSRIAFKRLRWAVKWFGSVKPRTLLRVQQQLYPRKDKWKGIQDYPEFLACQTVCITWLNLPKSRCDPADIEAKCKVMVREALERHEREVRAAHAKIGRPYDDEIPAPGSYREPE